ncbi:MAG: hypothetical protein U0166_23425 [Acidobacteriota bacterium]
MSFLGRMRQAIARAGTHAAGGQYERALRQLGHEPWGGKVRIPPRQVLARFAIDALHPGRHPEPAPPWHGDGGAWTFFDASLDGSAAVFTVGVCHGDGADVALPFGRARIAVSERTQGERFLLAIADAAGEPVPAPREPAPLAPCDTRTVVFATDLCRELDGGFGGVGGGWTACKWMLDRSGRHAELLINYNLTERRGELAVKDPGARADLLWLLAMLRDGPPRERSPDNDLTLTDDGPRFEGFAPFLVPTAHYHGATVGGSLLVCSQAATGGGRDILLVDPERPLEPRGIGRVAGAIGRVACAGERADHALVWEIVPRDPSRPGDHDPARFWLIDRAAGVTLPVAGPWGERDVHPATSPIRHDGAVVALTAWASAPSARRPHRIIHLHDVRHASTRTLDVAGASLDVVGWHGDGRAIVLGGDEDGAFDARPAYLADAATGALEELAGRAALVPVDPDVSPDGRFRIARLPRSGFVLTETVSGQERVLALHPDDARYAVPGCTEWISPRHLLFDAARPAIIDVDTLKMSYPLPPEEPAPRVFVVEGFRWVVLARPSGLALGRVAPG